MEGFLGSYCTRCQTCGTTPGGAKYTKGLKEQGHLPCTVRDHPGGGQCIIDISELCDRPCSVRNRSVGSHARARPSLLSNSISLHREAIFSSLTKEERCLCPSCFWLNPSEHHRRDMDRASRQNDKGGVEQEHKHIQVKQIPADPQKSAQEHTQPHGQV